MLTLRSWIIMFFFVLFQTAFMIGLRYPDERYWTEWVAVIGVAIVAVGLIWVLWGKGVNRLWAILTVVSMGILVWAAETQAKNLDSIDGLTMFIHVLSVIAVVFCFWRAIRDMKVSRTSKLWTTISLAANESLLVVYLASETEYLWWQLLAASTVALGVGFGVILWQLDKKTR